MAAETAEAPAEETVVDTQQADETKKPAKTRTKKSDNRPKAKQVKIDHWTIPLSRITAVDNCRNEPENLFALGYKLVDSSDKEHSLIHMALSEDIEVVRQVVSLFETHECEPMELDVATVEDEDSKQVTPPASSIVAFARRLARYGQFHPVMVRKGNKLSDGNYNFTLLAGNRRTSATLYNHAKSRVDVADEVEGAKIYPAEVIATNKQVNDDEGFLISVEENLSNKRLTALQEAAIYKNFRSRINPASGKKWTLTEIAEYLYPGQKKKGTVRNREALLRPRKEARIDEETGEVIKPATGLTDKDRADLESGRMTLTAATRKALGEQHYSESTARQSTRAKPIPLKEMQKLFDQTDEDNAEFRKGVAACMNITYEQACEESEKRIQAEEAKTLRVRKK